MNTHRSTDRTEFGRIHGHGFITAQMLDRSEWHQQAIEAFDHRKRLQQIPATPGHPRLSVDFNRLSNAVGTLLIRVGARLQSADARIGHIVHVIHKPH